MYNRIYWITLLSICFLVELGFAAWPTDTINNIKVCLASGDQEYPDIASDGSGGAIIVWQDGRSSGKKIYAQRIDSSGIVKWTTNGILVSNAYNSQIPKLASDGVGGAIIAWFDFRGNTWPNSTLCVQRINSNGDTLWQANGVVLSSNANSWPYPVILGYGKNGAIISWIGLNGEIMAQRIDTAGVVQWTPGGVQLDSEGGVPQITTDNTNGAIVTWFDYNDQNPNTTDIFARRINSSGSAMWQGVGDTMCVVDNYQIYPNIAPDGNGGAIISWIDSRLDTSSYPYAQRVSADGGIYWARNGIQVSPMKAYYQIKIASDGLGGAVIAWLGGYSGSGDVYVQRFDGSGVGQWQDNLRISQLSEPTIPSVISDGSTGVFVLWQHPAYNMVKVQHISSNGTCSFWPDGKTVSTGYGMSGRFAITTEGKGSAIVAWEDRPSYDMNICAQRFVVPGFTTGVAEHNQSGTAPREFTLNQNYPNPFNPATTITFTLQENSYVSLKVFDILGRDVATLVNKQLPAGKQHQVTFDASKLSTGMYFYRLQSGENVQVKKLMIIK